MTDKEKELKAEIERLHDVITEILYRADEQLGYELDTSDLDI